MEKKLYWLLTGGTIVCDDKDSTAGLSPSEKIAYRIALSLPYNISPEIIPISNIDSTEMTPLLYEKIALTIDSLKANAKGIVITTGTDTMAYMGATLYFMLENISIPVVITGSQLPYFKENSDGPCNLADAFLLAGCEEFSGVAVVFDKKIIPPRYCYKAYSKSKAGFISVKDYYGRIEKGEFSLSYTPPKGEYKYHPLVRKAIALIKLTPYINEDSIIPLIKNSEGVIIEGYGVGGIPKRIAEILSPIADNKPVWVVSQCIYDGVDMDIYAVGKAAEEWGIKSSEEFTSESAIAKMATMPGNK